MWEEKLNKLTEEEHEHIMELRAGGNNLTAIGKRLGVSVMTISRIVRHYKIMKCKPAGRPQYKRHKWKGRKCERCGAERQNQIHLP